MGAAASTSFDTGGGNVTEVKPFQAASNFRPAQQPPQPREHILDDIACFNHLDTIKYYDEVTGDVFCEKCMEEDSQTRERDSIHDIESFVCSYKFKQIEVRTKHEFEKKKARMQDELSRAGDYKTRVENKRRDLHRQIRNFEKDLQVLVRHLAEDLQEKVSDVLDNKAAKKSLWLDELKSQLENARRLSDHRDTIKSKSAALRLKALLDYQTAIRSVKLVEDESTDPEDLKLDLNVDLTLKDILGERNLYRAVELGDFVDKDSIEVLSKNGTGAK